MSEKIVGSNSLSKAEKEEQLVKAVKNNDTLSFVELLGIYSRIISILALSFNLPRDEFDDLCQEGRIALYKACIGYEDKGGTFSTYASACIKNAMTDFAMHYGKQKSNESAVSIDDNKVTDISLKVTLADIKDGSFTIRSGKKNFRKVIVG